MAQRSFKLSDELDAHLAMVAQADGRSVSNLIVRLLEQALRHGSVKPKADVRTDGPRPNAHKHAATLLIDEPSEGTPLPKIAPRKQR